MTGQVQSVHHAISNTCDLMVGQSTICDANLKSRVQVRHDHAACTCMLRCRHPRYTEVPSFKVHLTDVRVGGWASKRSPKGLKQKWQRGRRFKQNQNTGKKKAPDVRIPFTAFKPITGGPARKKQGNREGKRTASFSMVLLRGAGCRDSDNACPAPSPASDAGPGSNTHCKALSNKKRIAPFSVRLRGVPVSSMRMQSQH